MIMREGSFRRTFRSAALFPVSPAAVAGKIAGSGRWSGAFLLVSLLTVAGGFLHLAAEEAALDVLPQDRDVASVRPILRLLEAGGALVSPLGLLAKWLIFAGLILIVLRLLDLRRPAWTELYALLVHSEMIFAVTVFVGGLLAFFQVLSGGAILPLQALYGLALLLPPVYAGTLIEAIASQLSVFSVWYVFAAGVGLSVLGGEGRAACIGAAALAWLLQAVAVGALHWTLNVPPPY